MNTDTEFVPVQYLSRWYPILKCLWALCALYHTLYSKAIASVQNMSMHNFFWGEEGGAFSLCSQNTKCFFWVCFLFMVPWWPGYIMPFSLCWPLQASQSLTGYLVVTIRDWGICGVQGLVTRVRMERLQVLLLHLLCPRTGGWWEGLTQCPVSPLDEMKNWERAWKNPELVAVEVGCHVENL